MSDYSPPYTEEDTKFDDRVVQIEKRVRRLQASRFTVGELLDIIQALQPGERYHCVGKRDLEAIEKILED